MYVCNVHYVHINVGRGVHLNICASVYIVFLGHLSPYKDTGSDSVLKSVSVYIYIPRPLVGRTVVYKYNKYTN